ncbi:MAG: hypothetical protein QM656_07820 [Paracoccaceae bacterium]
MQSVEIGQSDRDPAGDGDVNLYVAQEVANKPWFDHNRRVIFVNGMRTSPDTHARNARALSLVQSCPVIGVYNQTDGFWPDVGQCIRDKQDIREKPNPAGFDGWKQQIDTAYEAERQRDPALQKIQFVATYIKRNLATTKLYYLLASRIAKGIETSITCHSQGSLITSNALTAIALAMGKESLERVDVSSYGSPCKYWPETLRRTNYAFTFDIVSMLDATMDFTTSKVGYKLAHFGPLTHGFEYYLNSDSEFIVNRFRWGSFGLTASMNERGLAQFCIGLGTNTPRLRGIFAHLEKAHPSDADDVALEYVSRLSLADLRSLRDIDSGFLQQLGRILGSGYRSFAENQQRARLDQVLCSTF